MKITLPATPQQGQYFMLGGGVDTTTPPSTIAPGFARAALNFEEDVNGGYQRLKGYERFDGRPSPSANALFRVHNLKRRAGQPPPAVGMVVQGATSLATAKIIYVNPLNAEIVLTDVVGNFVPSDELYTPNSATGTDLGTIIGVQLIPDDDTALDYRHLAYLDFRNRITAVPGTGKVLGVWYFRGVVYAFRNNALGGVRMYKSSPSGWQLVNLGFEVAYNAGSGTPPVPGATITKGGTSGALAKITVESGSFGAGTAAGRLIFNSITSGPFTAGAFTGGITATVVSQLTVTIPNQNGRYQFVTANFAGRLEQANMYGCDGQNRAFEFDGTTYTPINTGLAGNDKPSFIVEHQKHLFLAVGSSVLNSSLGDPQNWQTTNGAGEKAMSDTVTGFAIRPGGTTDATLVVYCRNKLYALYGTSADDFQYIKYSDEAGGMPYSAQVLFQGLSLDDVGVLSLPQAQEYGNFKEATISQRIQDIINSRRGSLVDSHVVRQKQQYRLFFSDHTGVYFTIRKKSVSAMPVMFPDQMTCSCSQEAFGTSDELVFFGDEDGFVYQMERGNSFDGEPIEAVLELIFNHGNGYRALKKYRRITLEATGESLSRFYMTYKLGYYGDGISQPDDTQLAWLFSGKKWDQFVWDEFVWDGNNLLNNTLSTPGDAENVSVVINFSSNKYDTVKFNAVFIEHSPLRQMR